MLEVPTDKALQSAHQHLENWLRETLSLDELLRVPPLEMTWCDIEGVPRVCLEIATTPPTIAVYDTPEDRQRAHGIVHLLGTLPTSLSHHIGEVLGKHDGPECSTATIMDALLRRALQDPPDVRRFLDDMVLPSIVHWCAHHQSEAAALGVRIRLTHGPGVDGALWYCRVTARDEETEAWGGDLLLVIRRHNATGALQVDAGVLLSGPATHMGRWRRWLGARRCRRKMAMRMDGVLDTHRIVTGWWAGITPLLRTQGSPPPLGLP